MAQLNLKKILSSDNISTLVDTINHNFDQIILHGGGPQGLQGLIGAPGIPGRQGIQGETGETGADGTYIFSSNVGPTSYLFEGNQPRVNDLYLEVEPTYIKIWQKTTSDWDLIETVQSPSTGLKTYVNTYWNNNRISQNVSFVNDKNIAGSVYFGDVKSFGASAGIINNLNSDNNEFTVTYTTLQNSPNVMTLGGDKNQMRILCTVDGLLNDSDKGGGIIHSLEQNESKEQTYKIINGDIIGNKNLLINLNNTVPGKLFIGNTENKCLIGGQEGDTLNARLSINNSLAVGSNSFYSNVGSTVTGIISEGNLSVGATDNTLAKGAFYGLSGNNSKLLIDVDQSAALPTVSVLTIGSNNRVRSVYPKNNWNFSHDANTNKDNFTSGSLLLNNEFFISSANKYNVTHLFFTSVFSPDGISGPHIGVGNKNPSSLFEIGTGNLRTSIGDINNGYSGMSNYIGFNLHRNQISNNWISRNTTGTDVPNKNASGAIWSNGVNSFNFSIFSNNKNNSNTINYTDEQVFNANKLSISSAPGLYLSENIAINFNDTPYASGLIVDIGATGDLTDSDPNIGRRGVAIFGGGLSQSGYGTPYIYDTKGVTQGMYLKPQYSFLSSDMYGMYLAQGNTANPVNDKTEFGIGLAAEGQPGIHVTPTRVGIHQRSPYERLHIGDILTYHDGGNDSGGKFIGFNKYYCNKKSLLSSTPYNHKLITGYDSSDSIISKLKGAASINFDNFEQSPTQSFFNGMNIYGGSISIELYKPHNRNTFLSNTTLHDYSSERSTWSGVKFLPPLTVEKGVTNINVNNSVPKILMGMEDPVDGYVNNYPVHKRGTLSIASQSVSTGSDMIDDYAISLYSDQALPVFGIAPQMISNQQNGKSFKSVNFRLLSNKQSASGNYPGTIKNDDLNCLSIKADFNGGTDTFTKTLNDSRTITIDNGFKVLIGGAVAGSDMLSVNGSMRASSNVTTDNDFTTENDGAGWITINNSDIKFQFSNNKINYSNAPIDLSSTKIKYKRLGKTIIINFKIACGNSNNGWAPYWKITLPSSINVVIMDEGYGHLWFNWFDNNIQIEREYTTGVILNSTVPVYNINGFVSSLVMSYSYIGTYVLPHSGIIIRGQVISEIGIPELGII